MHAEGRLDVLDVLDEDNRHKNYQWGATASGNMIAFDHIVTLERGL